MTDLGELKQRVDHAVEELAVAQNARHQQHDALVQLLADLEVKFDARHEELVYCHSRIADLEKANDQLGDLLNTVVQLIESGSVQDPDDPIFRASKMAADLVTLCAQSPVEQITSGRKDDSDSRLVTVEAELIEDRPAIPQPQHAGLNPGPAAASPSADVAMPAQTPVPPVSTQPEPAAQPIPPHPEPTAQTAPVMPEPVAQPLPPQPEPAAQQALPEPADPVLSVGGFEVEFIDTDVPPPETSQAAIETPAMAGHGQIGLDATATSAAPITGRFEDVSQEELDVELLLDDDLDDPSLPQALLLAVQAAKMNVDEMVGRLADVSAAVDAARRGETAVAADQSDRQELDIPGIETVVDFDIVDHAEESSLVPNDDLAAAADAGDTDIKALMARIQEAAEKARARADAEPESEPTLVPNHTPGKTGTS